MNADKHPVNVKESMVDFDIIKVAANHAKAIIELYRNVASIEGGLARTRDEITDDFVESLIQNSVERGLIFIAVDMFSGKVLGEIHCYSPGIKVFDHVLSELTIAVDPLYQGKGIGKRLFNHLLNEVKQNRPHILRVELFARESNQKALKFYEKLGFKIEGKLSGRIKSSGEGYEADIPMAWIRN